jgi:hypothetical protein
MVTVSTATAYGQLVFDVSEPTWLAVQVAVARRTGLDISDGHPTAARRNKRRLWMPDDRHLAAGQISTADAGGSLAAAPDTAMRGTWTRTPPPDRQPTTAQPDVTFAVR